MTRVLRLFGVTALLSVFLFGCASMQPISNYARSGDTVAISLGGTHTNALAPVLKKENVSVAVHDSQGGQYEVKVRNLFRLYSDPTSRFEYRNLMGSNGFYEYYVEPHQGLWMAVIDLVDPVTEQPVPVQPGPATLSVSSTEILNWYDPTTWGWTWTNGNLDSVALEILPGTGAPNPMNYLQPVTFAPLDSLEPASQLEVAVQGTPDRMIGAATFVIQYDNSVFAGFDIPRVTSTTPDQNVQIAWGRQDQGDGTSLLTVMMLNPRGFNTNNNRANLYYVTGGGGSSLLRSLSFNLFWNNETIDDTNWPTYFQLVSSDYFDLNGDPIAGLSASVQKVR